MIEVRIFSVLLLAIIIIGALIVMRVRFARRTADYYRCCKEIEERNRKEVKWLRYRLERIDCWWVSKNRRIMYARELLNYATEARDKDPEVSELKLRLARLYESMPPVSRPGAHALQSGIIREVKGQLSSKWYTYVIARSLATLSALGVDESDRACGDADHEVPCKRLNV